MRAELEALLDRSANFQDRPLKWAKAWSLAADLYHVPCLRGNEIVTWLKWFWEVSEAARDRPYVTVEIIKESALIAIHGRQSEPGRDFGIDVRYEAWWNHTWGSSQYRAMCEELVAIHKDYGLTDYGFESYDHWLAELLKEAPPREVSL